jgi:hypothetical protein
MPGEHILLHRQERAIWWIHRKVAIPSQYQYFRAMSPSTAVFDQASDERHREIFSWPSLEGDGGVPSAHHSQSAQLPTTWIEEHGDQQFLQQFTVPTADSSAAEPQPLLEPIIWQADAHSIASDSTTSKAHAATCTHSIGTAPPIKCWQHGCNGRTFKSFRNYRRHCKEKDGLTSKSSCPVCGQEFSRPTAMRLHYENLRCKVVKYDANGVLFREPLFSREPLCTYETQRATTECAAAPPEIVRCYNGHWNISAAS